MLAADVGRYMSVHGVESLAITTISGVWLGTMVKAKLPE